MQLDHATIVTHDLDGVCRFFADVAGLARGRRPPFAVEGTWFYAGGRAAIHVVRATQPPTLPAVRASSRIDHVALRVDTHEAWQALVDRVQRAGLPHRPSAVPLAQELQLFVPVVPGVTVEFVKTMHEPDADVGPTGAFPSHPERTPS